MRQRDRCDRVGGPLAPYVRGFRTQLASEGYAPASIDHRLSQFGQISRWLEAERLEPIEFTAERVERFVAARRSAGRVTWASPASMALPLEYLRSIGVVPVKADAFPEGPLEELLGAYRGYLVGERGLAASTVGAYLRIARAFCLAVAAEPGGLGHLRAADVTGFVVAACGQSSIPAAKKTVTALASLLRYLHVAGVTANPLASAVPKVAGQRAGLLARGLEATQLARLLSGCDRRRRVGRRDYAIVTLLARLGLRAGEVAALTLDDFDWHHGEVVIRGKGHRYERLPLPCDVGEAVAAYLRRGRRGAPEGSRTLFTRTVAPPGALSPSAIQTVVRRAARRAGLPAFGSHLLRHGAATGMLRGGAPLPEVAQVLRHRSLMVTAAYAKVEPAALRALARPWPGGAA